MLLIIAIKKNSGVLYTFVPNRSFGQLYISPKNFIFLERFNSEFLYIEVWLTDLSHLRYKIK